jgi:hypothetical protein
MTKRTRSTGLVPVATLCTPVACTSVGIGFSVPIGGAGSIGVAMGGGRFGGSVGVGKGGAGVAVGGSTTLTHGVDAAAPAASAAQ